MSAAVAAGLLAAAAVGLLGSALQSMVRRQLQAVVAAGPAGSPLRRIAPSQRSIPIITTRRQRQITARAAADLPDALEMIILAVRAGHLPSAAIRASLAHLPDTVRPAFAAVLAQVDDGCRFADAIGELAKHLGDSAQVLVDSFAAADRYGLPLAPVLDRLAAEARQQRARCTATLARQLPIRLAAPLVTCTLPSFVLLAVVPLLLAALSSLRW